MEHTTPPTALDVVYYHTHFCIVRYQATQILPPFLRKLCSDTNPYETVSMQKEEKIIISTYTRSNKSPGGRNGSELVQIRERFPQHVSRGREVV